MDFVLFSFLKGLLGAISSHLRKQNSCRNGKKADLKTCKATWKNLKYRCTDQLVIDYNQSVLWFKPILNRKSKVGLDQ